MGAVCLLFVILRDIGSGWQWCCSQAVQKDSSLGQDCQTCFQLVNLGTQSDSSHCRFTRHVFDFLDAMAGLLWTNCFGQTNLPGTVVVMHDLGNLFALDILFRLNACLLYFYIVACTGLQSVNNPQWTVNHCKLTENLEIRHLNLNAASFKACGYSLAIKQKYM